MTTYGQLHRSSSALLRPIAYPVGSHELGS